MWTLQIIEPYSNRNHAREAMRALSEHAGFLGGNYGEQGTGYYVQAFFSAGTPWPIDPNVRRDVDNLPDGAKYVFVPDLLQKWYGFTEAN